MFVSRRMCLFLLCIGLLGGCYEDTVELTLNSDGSGTLKQRLVLSERFVVATEENNQAQNVPVANKEEIVEKIGSALDITSAKQTNLPNGARLIEFEGTFSEPEQFFLSDYCREQIKLRIVPAGEDQAAIYCDMKQSGDGGPNLEQLYGLAKGLYINRTISLPAEIAKTNGYLKKAENTVSWAIDLRNKDGLAETKEFVEGPHEGAGSVVFDASELGFTLPLKVAAVTEEGSVEKDKTSKESPASGGFAAKVAWVSVKKKMPTEGPRGAAQMSDLEIGVELTWNEGHSPVRCEKPVLLNLLDDLNNNLVSDKGPRVHQGRIFTREKNDRKKELTLRAETPAKDAKKLKQLEGYIEVVTDVAKETVVLEDVQELSGRDFTGNPVLDKLNFKIKSIKGRTLKVEIDGGHQTITSVAVIKKDSSRVEKSGGMGWGNEYSYDFREDISEAAKLELQVVVEESVVKVPFSLEEVVLP